MTLLQQTLKHAAHDFLVILYQKLTIQYDSKSITNKHASNIEPQQTCYCGNQYLIAYVDLQHGNYLNRGNTILIKNISAFFVYMSQIYDFLNKWNCIFAE